MRTYCLPDTNVKQVREVSPSARQHMRMCISVTLLQPLQLGKCPNSRRAGVFSPSLSEVLAASEGGAGGLAASFPVSRSLVSWFGDWKTGAAASKE